MEELGKIRNAYPDPGGPSADAASRARRRLEDEITASSRQKASLRLRPGWLGAALTASAAVAVVAGLAVPLASRPGPDEQPPASESGSVTAPPRQVTAGQVLREVAELQERDARVVGKYYRVRMLHLSDFAVVGQPPYTIERRTITEGWLPMRRDLRPWLGWVDLGYHPATPADEARWREQGQQLTWKLPAGRGAANQRGGLPVVRPLVPPKLMKRLLKVGMKPFDAELLATLPTEPDQLRAALTKGWVNAPAAQQNYDLFSAAVRLLFETPAQPKLRAAALRMIAELPGLSLRPGAVDALGRSGTAVSISAAEVKPRPTRPGEPQLTGDPHLVVDPTTGRLLSSTLDIPDHHTTAVLDSTWTNDTPTAPSPNYR